jgi:RNA polymerase sigma factor (sigma-70 family)
MDQGFDQLFRRESGRLVATLTRFFGIHNLALAEDVVQDAYVRAVEVWKYHGVPDDPAAWLMVTAKRRAFDMLRRERTVRMFAPELQQLLESEWTIVPTVERAFESKMIKDDLLRMMFTCCHPKLADEAQIALILNILCGFNVSEVAAAFVTGQAAMEKRIQRAKKTLGKSRSLFQVAAESVRTRLPSVQHAIYLLFNEGYHGACREAAVRIDLCKEAMYLAELLRENNLTTARSTFALSALMCFHAARLPGRTDAGGEFIPFAIQDRLSWDQRLIEEGHRLLDQAANGSSMTEYHVEAAIAGLHALAPSPERTDWRSIVMLYDQLMRLRPSPIVALNRSVAVAQVEGPERGLAEIRGIAEAERLKVYPFYHAALGELEFRRGRNDLARQHFRAALAIGRNDMERKFYQQRIQSCEAT